MSLPTVELKPLPPGSVNRPKFSRFAKQTMFRYDDGRPFWGTRLPVALDPSPRDSYHLVDAQTESRIDLVSYRYYRTPELWWVIAEANDLSFPPEDLVVGRVLRIPSEETVSALGIR